MISVEGCGGVASGPVDGRSTGATAEESVVALFRILLLLTQHGRFSEGVFGGGGLSAEESAVPLGVPFGVSGKGVSCPCSRFGLV